jgi:WD40 repeat protein
MFDLHTGQDARFHDEMITTLAIKHDDTIVLTGSSDKTARLIHLHNGQVSNTTARLVSINRTSQCFASSHKYPMLEETSNQ